MRGGNWKTCSRPRRGRWRSRPPRGGGFIAIPDAAYPFKFRLGHPYGTEFIKVAASTRQFADVEKDFADLSGVAEALVSYTIVEK
jgi:hypothetical protein